MKNNEVANFYDTVFRAESYVTGKDKEGMIVVVIPRFKSGVMRRWMKQIGRDPDFKIKLDEHGSAVWRLIDGKHDVSEIIAELAGHFDNEKDYEYRIIKFLQTLYEKKIICC
jgi:hypothetical protein